ncbi:MAG: hypothetical protein ACPHAP_07830 [Candidatus Puniceispirillaceae bacterium]
MARPALRELLALLAIPGKLELGPHGKALLDELVMAARADHHLTVIILAAALVDIIAHEGAEMDFSDSSFDDAPEDGYGLSMLRAGERRALDQLRAMRNRILHYQGMGEGFGTQAGDKSYLADQADAAITALLPVLELQESY